MHLNGYITKNSFISIFYESYEIPQHWAKLGEISKKIEARVDQANGLVGIISIRPHLHNKKFLKEEKN
jgi:hypothetical protein